MQTIESLPPQPPQHAQSTGKGTVTLDLRGRVVVPIAAASAAAALRIGLGLLYLWAFISQGFGVIYTNTATSSSGTVTYGWHFTYDSSKGWITSGFKHSPTEGFVSSLHGPLAFISQKPPTGFDDFVWIFVMAGLGIALPLGIFMRVAGFGGFLLNIILWFSVFPPSGNPIIDGEHMAFAFSLLLLALLHAGNWAGFGRWWESHTPRIIH